MGADGKRAAHQALVDRVVRGPGTMTGQQREAAFANADVDPALQPLIGKVATAPTRITDADFDQARAAGFTEDQLFEVVVAAAVGQSSRMYASALAALDEAAAG
jgi:alkylhydroperoxidase family enzyme